MACRHPTQAAMATEMKRTEVKRQNKQIALIVPDSFAWLILKKEHIRTGNTKMKAIDRKATAEVPASLQSVQTLDGGS
jgi:hypothetical protein